MRRKDKAIESREELARILRQGSVCWLSMVDEGKPYVVPVSYGYAENRLFIHSAPEGRKIDIIRKDPQVCFSVVTGYEMVRAEKACSWSAGFRSVTGFGKAAILTGRMEKEEGLALLMAHYTDKKFDFSGSGLENLVIIKVEIEEMEGKRGS